MPEFIFEMTEYVQSRMVLLNRKRNRSMNELNRDYLDELAKRPFIENAEEAMRTILG